MKREKIHDGLTLIEKEDGYYAYIDLPMYPTDITFLWTRDYDKARTKAITLYNDMKNYK